SASADLVEFVEHDDHVSFDVSTNDPPYKGVRGRGHATVAPDDDKRLLRTLLRRYLGGVDNATADRLLRPEREEVEIRIEPERLHAWDYSERMKSTDRSGRTGPADE
ncbi:pyridoxamine 5'-phosphate oxidase family protein, partial [Halorubrum sp. SS7]